MKIKNLIVSGAALAAVIVGAPLAAAGVATSAAWAPVRAAAATVADASVADASAATRPPSYACGWRYRQIGMTRFGPIYAWVRVCWQTGPGPTV